MQNLNKLYILVSEKLDPTYGFVQGGHAVAQFLLDNPKQTWNNEYLIFTKADLSLWQERLDLLEIKYSYFKEPDLNNEITALAVHNIGDEGIFSKLELLQL